MNIKYDVGQKVLVQGIVKNVKIDSTGLLYGVEFCGKVHNFKEEEVYPIPSGEADKDAENI